MSRARRLTIEVVGDAESVRRTLGQVSGDLDQAGRSAETFGDRLSSQGQRMADFGDQWTRRVSMPIIAGLGGMFALSERQEVAEARLAAVIRATGGAAGVTAEHVKELASQQQALTTFGDEATIAAAAQLLTFRSLRNEVGEGNQVFDRTIVAAQDLSALFGTDLNSSVMQLGRSLEDPISGLTALRRSGISFTVAQRDQIRVLVESGQLFEAQKLILAEVETQVSGTAQAIAQTAGGQLRQSLNELGDSGEKIGAAVAPAVSALAGFASMAAGAIDMLPGPLVTTAVGIAGVAAAAGPLMSIGGRMLQWAGAFANNLDAVRLRGMYAADSMRNLATRLGPMGIAGVAGVAAVGVGLLVNHIQQSRQRAEEARQRVSAYADAIRDAGDAAEGTARNLDRVIQENDRIRESLVRSGSSVDEMTEAIHGSDEAWDEWVASQVAAADAAGENMFAIGALEAALRREREAAREGASATAEYEQVASTTGDTAVDTASDIDTMTTAVDHQAERITMLSQAINDLLSETFGIDEAQRRWEDNIDSLTDHVAEHGTTLDVTTSAGRRNAEQIQRQVEAGARWLQTLAEQGASESELAAAQATLQAALGDTLSQLGFNEEEARRYIDALGDVPVELVTEVRVVTAQAMADINALNQRLAEVNGARLAGGVGGAANRMHTGGIFRPSGGGREGWAWLEDGEGVFTRDQMRALGAAAGVDGGSTREGAQRGQMVFNGPVTFGSDRAVADVDFWWQTKGAGV